jgi:hypothetical protein
VSLGFPLGKADIDNKAGSLVVGVRDALDRCKQMCDLLNNTNIIPNDAFLTGLSYSGAEVTTLRAAFTDLKALYNVAHAAGTVPSNNDFFFNAQKLTGVVLL